MEIEILKIIAFAYMVGYAFRMRWLAKQVIQQVENEGNMSMEAWDVFYKYKRKLEIKTTYKGKVK